MTSLPAATPSPDAMHRYRVKDGVIREHLALFRQLGLVPEPV